VHKPQLEHCADGSRAHSLSLRVASEKFSSQVDSPKRLKHITSILRPLRSVPAVRAYGVLQSVFFIAGLLAF